VNAKQRRALTNAGVAAGLTALLGLLIVALLPGEDGTGSIPLPTGPTSTPVACEPTWDVVPSPDPEDGGSLLLGVVAVAPDLAWAVGGAGDPVAPTSTLVVRWNGAEWDVVPSPNAGSATNRFDAVDALSPDAAWAVGRSSNGVGDVPTAAQWDGGSWTLLPSPLDVTEGAFTGVAAISTDDVWVVGYEGDAEVGEERALAVHWNGLGWEIAPVQPAIGGGRSGLLAISGSSGSDLWAVGYRHNRPVILRYDGRVWARSPSDVPGEVTAITNLAPDDAWAVGEAVQHWDGSTWGELGTVRAEGSLFGVAAVAPEDVWAVGSRITGGQGLVKPLVQRWDGIRWRLLGGQGVPGQGALTAVSALPDGTLLAVGYRDGQAGRSTLALRGTTCLDA
jgi:hypothetical protein